MRLTKEQIQAAVLTIFEHLSKGKSDKYIMRKMGFTAEEYEKIKIALFDYKADELRKRPDEHAYVEYLLNQNQNLRDLTKMIDNFDEAKQHSAMVAAIRVRAEIYDKLIAKAQEFGLIRKTPERKEIVAGVMVAELSNKELKKALVSELKMLDDLNRKFGGGDITSLPRPESLHSGPALPAPGEKPPRKKSKTHKTKMNKVLGGRKRKMPHAPIPSDVIDI